jgi:GNAT superfamily N-acetyltransferase
MAATAAVRTAERSEYPELARTLTRAFADDPVMAWFLPDVDRRLARMERFFRDLELRGPFGRHGEIFTTDDLAAVALWLPPGRWRLGPVDQLRMLPGLIRLVSLRVLPSRLAGFQAVERRHPSAPPHWYLATLGTDPHRQGQGLGSALLADQLARCDADGLPSYLESSKESNVPFYERHGFVVTDTYDFADGPRLWLMWRDPR